MRLRTIVALILAALIICLGAVLLTDRPGFEVQYFALDPTWSTKPIYSDVGLPELSGPDELVGVLVSRQIFGIRWRGRFFVNRPGSFRFRAMTRLGGGSFMNIDGETVLTTKDQVGHRRENAQHTLAPGWHTLEIGYGHTAGRPIFFKSAWSVENGGWRPFSADEAYFGPLLSVRRAVRSIFSELSILGRRLLGVCLLALGILLSVRPLHGFAARLLPPGLRASELVRKVTTKRLVWWMFVISLCVVVWRLSFPLTGGIADGDDVRYLYAAAFAKKMGWIVNRYVHVYLLKLFMFLSDGDSFLGARAYWSFMLAVTLGSLALAVRSLGRGFQLRTLAVTLFLAMSQASLFSGIGVAYADFSAMMFITLSVAIYLHGLLRTGPGGDRWHAVVLGALLVAAIKSKETGLILLWLPLLFLWTNGRLDLWNFLRRLAYWVGGGAIACVVLMSLDAWILGDFFFSVRPETLSGLGRLHEASEGKSKWESLIWLQVVWSGTPRIHPISFGLRHLGVLVVLAAITTLWMKKRTELRLLHLMPIAYLGLMIAIHPAFFSTRFMLPIVPVSCLLGAMLFWHCGLEELRWQDLVSARLIVPALLTAAVVALVVVPLRTGLIQTASREVFEFGFDILAVVGLVVTGLAVFFLGNRYRITVLLICLVGFFTGGYITTRQALDRQLAVQRSRLILYPWTAFRGPIERARPKTLVVSRAIVRKYDMTGQRVTRSRIARMFFRREHLRVAETQEIGSRLESLIGDLADYEIWIGQIPGIDKTAERDATGQFVLVQPRQVVEQGPD